MSVAITVYAFFAFDVITCGGPNIPLPLIFSSHAILLSPSEAVAISRSPSPSRSAATALRGETSSAVTMVSSPTFDSNKFLVVWYDHSILSRCVDLPKPI